LRAIAEYFIEEAERLQQQDAALESRGELPVNSRRIHEVLETASRVLGQILPFEHRRLAPSTAVQVNQGGGTVNLIMHPDDLRL
jgi:hypothetical protein